MPRSTIESITNAINNPRVDKTPLTINKADLCDNEIAKAIDEAGFKCQRNNIFHVDVIYKNKSGAELVISGVQPIQGIFRPSKVNCSATVNGKKISLGECSSLLSEAEKTLKPNLSNNTISSSGRTTDNSSIVVAKGNLP